MWEELIGGIAKQDGFISYLDKLQLSVAGYVDLDKGWDLTVINPWFVERGYEFVGYLDLFSENEPSGVYVNVDGYVWYCRTNAHDNSIYWYWESDNEGMTLDDMRFLHGYAHMFIWDNDTKTCEVINLID